MELRKTEETIQDLISTYESIRQSTVLKPEQAKLLLPLPSDNFSFSTPEAVPVPVPADAAANEPSAADADGESSDKNVKDDAKAPITVVPVPVVVVTTTMPALLPDLSKRRPPSDLESLVQTLQWMQDTLSGGDLPNSMERFRSRLDQVDSVTGRPRYGPKSHARVQRMLVYYTFLRQQHLSSSDDNNEQPNHAALALFEELKQQFQQEQSILQQQQAAAEQAKLLEQQRLEQQRQEQEAQQKAQAEAAAKEQAMKQAAEEERLRQQAEAARQRRQAQIEARRQAEQQYLDSIHKGVEGVQHYVNVIKESTSDDPAAQSKAFSSLYTLFEQILKHPEEPNFRRIRKNHPVFHQDIGRHKGGIELLIAAGFRPKALPDMNSNGNTDTATESATTSGEDDDDETPKIDCLISKEPNLEVDMDAWSQWYDLKKATLEILQKETSANKKPR